MEKTEYLDTIITANGKTDREFNNGEQKKTHLLTKNKKKS
jgi:hypothetical protein